MSANDKSRMTAYALDPNTITIIGGLNMPEGGIEGVDTADKGGVGYDARVLKPLDESDILNVCDMGVLQPIILRKDGARNVVMAGRQRLRWARAASKRLGTVVKVPCVFRQGTDLDALKVLVAENEHREGDTFENQARKCQQLSNYGATEEEIAVVMRCTTAAVRQWMKFFDLAPEVQASMKAGDISGSAAIRLVDLPRAEQAEVVTELVEEAKAKGKAKVAVADAEQKARVRSGKKDADTTKRPGLRLMTKVLSHEDAEVLPEGFLLGLRWAMGDLPAAKVRGLTAILRDVQGGGAADDDAEDAAPKGKGKGKTVKGTVLFTASDDE